MVKLLVGIDAKMTGLWSVVYALNLAKRMDIKIAVLLVSDTAPQTLSPSPSAGEETSEKDETAIKRRLEKLITDGRSEGISIDYYLAYGSYKEEIIKFIKEKGITLLVVDFPSPDRKEASEKLPELLGEIKLRTHCRIEVVHQKDVK
ncbi:MAG: universal stress protein [Desulfobacteraceae bacterium]|nr:universal stress protein [Desulfobacteraceae bacterium]